MLDRRQRNDLQVSEPTEPPVEVDWQAWWVAIDKRIQEHLVDERQLIVDAAAYAIVDLRKEIAENDQLRGPPGRPGKDAKLPRVKIWQEDTVYYEGDCVAFAGSLYQAQCDTGKSPLFPKHWMCLATAGANGKPIRHRGEFQADVKYREHDAVRVGGSSFVALRDDPGPCPGRGWTLLAAAGQDGKDGATGPRGERGERGLIGPRGEPAPTITGWRVDRSSYTAVPISNGIEGAPLELRGLFEQFFQEVASPVRA
jgi:hypothetical protein